MLRPNVLLANLIVLPASLLACQAWTSGPGAVLQHSPGAAAESTPISLALELDRAILILKRGLKENWATRDQYLTAFESTPSTEHAGRPVADAKKYVECAIGAHLRTHQLWDEGPPIEVEVRRTIVEFTKRRNEAEIWADLPCFIGEFEDFEAGNEGLQFSSPHHPARASLPMERPDSRRVWAWRRFAALMGETVSVRVERS